MTERTERCTPISTTMIIRRGRMIICRRRNTPATMCSTNFECTGTCPRSSVTNTVTTSPKWRNGAYFRTLATSSAVTGSACCTIRACSRLCSTAAAVLGANTWSETEACPTKATSPSTWRYSPET